MIMSITAPGLVRFEAGWPLEEQRPFDRIPGWFAWIFRHSSQHCADRTTSRFWSVHNL